MKIKNVIFMGTPQFAVPSLIELHNSQYKPILVITQPDRPSGRKKRLTPPEVKVEAEKLGMNIIQPEDVNSPEVLDYIESLQPDIIITVAYGGLLKKRIRHLPKLGCINLHPSLLPKYRGPAPMNFTLFNGDKITGNTIFKIRASVDSGKILLQNKTEISPEENYTDLHKRLSISGAKDIITCLELLEKEEIHYVEQDHSNATFTHKIKKEDMFIDWNNEAFILHNKIRGLAEVPGAVASFRNIRIKIIQTEILEEVSNHDPGVVLDIIKNKGIIIATKTNDLLIKKVQPAGKKIMGGYEYNLGARINIGEKFEPGF